MRFSAKGHRLPMLLTPKWTPYSVVAWYPPRADVEEERETEGPFSCSNVQVGENDILAVRFPNSREDPGFALETDDRLLDREAIDHGLLDFVVADLERERAIQKNATSVEARQVTHEIETTNLSLDEHHDVVLIQPL